MFESRLKEREVEGGREEILSLSLFRHRGHIRSSYSESPFLISCSAVDPTLGLS